MCSCSGNSPQYFCVPLAPYGGCSPSTSGAWHIRPPPDGASATGPWAVVLFPHTVLQHPCLHPSPPEPCRGLGTKGWLSPAWHRCPQQEWGAGCPDPIAHRGNRAVTDLPRRGACVALPALGAILGSCHSRPQRRRDPPQRGCTKHGVCETAGPPWQPGDAIAARSTPRFSQDHTSDMPSTRGSAGHLNLRAGLDCILGNNIHRLHMAVVES